MAVALLMEALGSRLREIIPEAGLARPWRPI